MVKNKSFIFALIALNFVWTISSLAYDWSELTHQPFYLWPFLIICPLYPFLLALVWLKIIRQQTPNNYLLAFAAIGASFFGALSILFYPVVMLIEGFNWLTFGAIFWVLFYGIQGWYLLFTPNTTLKKWPTILATLYLVTKIFLDWRYNTFGYMSQNEELPIDSLALSAMAILFVILLNTVHLRRLSAQPQETSQA
ncbi:MAG TPA: hypothetical protein PLC05_01520 [bacterium]|nr:hypothetical protein [bacterium]HOR57302.1 hypothetical protein [bacterium]HPL56163.1 hypothetical protein [bacterium]